MKVLLVSSYKLPDGAPLFPLGLAHIASMLDGHEVRCFDLMVDGPADTVWGITLMAFFGRKASV